jgi:riboflavin kinase/FMN adenylyltransferase
MKIIDLKQAKKTRFKHLSLALGTFDGLHIGHMALIDALKTYGGQSAVFTFDSLPMDLFSAEHKPMRLFTLEEKKEAFARTGIDYLCITHFDQRFANLDRHGFTMMLKKVFSPEHVVAGYNYTYGRHAKGDVDMLTHDGASLGFETQIIPPVIYDGEPISSTRIRECIAAGSMMRANALLGYAYDIRGIVQRGQGIGDKLGFPTANITVAREKIIPRRGVYATHVMVGGDRYCGVCNVGTRPTVSSDNRETIEVHILNLNKNIYGEEIIIYFDKRLRDEKKFNNTDELIAQIQFDISQL